jgi:hypothetical protein
MWSRRPRPYMGCSANQKKKKKKTSLRYPFGIYQEGGGGRGTESGFVCRARFEPRIFLM